MYNIDFCIQATKTCTKALMRLSYINYLKKESLVDRDNKISNQNVFYKQNYSK